MKDFANMTLEELTTTAGHDCACGKHHGTHIAYLRIAPGAVRQVPEALDALSRKKPFVVCDANTYEAAGKAVMQVLQEAGIAYGSFVFPASGAKMEPDEAAIGSIVMAFDPSCDVLLAVGSGVINDCCKVVAHAAGIPSMVVGTAPSMDGYASNSSSMIQNHVKVSLYNACPSAILCDIDIMRQAPMHMLLAGLGDMLAKYISICEWRISHLVTGEYYCENIAQMMRTSVARCMDAADGLVRREPEAVRAVIEGLVLSGIAMSYAEISRPASGVEHYFSHVWEMMALERGEDSDLHGTQVGVGTALSLKLYDKIREIQPDRETAIAARDAFSQTAWEAEVHDIFGNIAGTIIGAEKALGLNDAGRRTERMERIIRGWPEILTIIREEMPASEAVIGRMEALHMYTTPKELGVNTQDTRRAFLGSRVIRDKYLTSTLLWDLGLLEAFAETLKDA